MMASTSFLYEFVLQITPRYVPPVPTTACGLDAHALPPSALGEHGLHCDSLLRATVEQLLPPARGPAVEPGREIIQIRIQVRRRDTSLVNPQEPACEQGDHPIDAGQQVLPTAASFRTMSRRYPCAATWLYPGRPSVRTTLPGSIKPTQANHVGPARLLRGEPALKLHERAWAVLHGRTDYPLSILESSA